MTAWISENYIEIAGVLFSFAYLWFSIRQRILLWLMGIISAALYVFVFFQAKFYADMGLNIYYVLISIYGWVVWRKGARNSGIARERDGVAKEATAEVVSRLTVGVADEVKDGVTDEVSSGEISVAGSGERTILTKRESNKGGSVEGKMPIRRLTLSLAGLLSGITIVLFIVIGFILKNYTDSPLPYWDALTTAASITATWMLARKYLEHWIIWIVVDALSIGLYIYRGLYPTVILFVVYSTMAVIGFIEWKKEAPLQKTA